MPALPLNLALAIVCILSPDARPETAPCPLPSFQTVAIHLELMDARETRYTFVAPEEFACDLAMIQRRAELLADAPLAIDAMRLPDRMECLRQKAFNINYQTWLRQRKEMFPEPWIDAALSQTEELYQIWDKAYDAQLAMYYVTYRRQCLLDLLNLVGPQLYYAGCLPAPVPVWPFRRID